MTEIRLYDERFEGDYKLVEPRHLKNRNMYRVRLETKREIALTGSEVQAMITRERVFGVVDVAAVPKKGRRK